MKGGDGGRRRVVIGVGNRLRGDDGAGPAALDRLAGRLPPAVEMAECPGGVAELLAAWEGAASVYVVDCAGPGAGSVGAPGAVHRIDASIDPLPAALGAASSHGLGLATAVELARTLGRLPPKLVVYAVAGDRFTPGTGVSPAVARGAAGAADAIAAELGQGDAASTRAVAEIRARG